MKMTAKEKDVTLGLLNGMYMMLKKNNYELLTENIYKCPQKVADPMVRAILSYGYLNADKTLEILMDCFQIYKKYFDQIETDDGFNDLVKESSEISNKYDLAEGEYARTMLIAFIDEIELRYKDKKAKEEREAAVC